MSSTEKWEREVERRELHSLVEGGLVGPTRLGEMLADAGFRPAPNAWRGFVYEHALSIGALLVAAGAGFFVAANWSELSLFARLGAVGVPFGLATFLSALLHRSVAGRAAGVLAGLLFGPLLAIFGQTFQTGADPWQLFFVWSVVVVLYGVVARSSELGVAALLLVHVTAFTFVVQEVGVEPYTERSVLPFVGFAMVDLGLAVVCARFVVEKQRFLERLCALGALGILLPFALLGASLEARGAQYWGVFGFFAVLAGLVWASTRKRPDFVIVAVSTAAFLVCSSTLLGRLILDRAEFFGAFVLGIVVSVKVWFASRALNRYRKSRDWEVQP